MYVYLSPCGIWGNSDRYISVYNGQNGPTFHKEKKTKEYQVCDEVKQVHDSVPLPCPLLFKFLMLVLVFVLISQV